MRTATLLALGTLFTLAAHAQVPPPPDLSREATPADARNQRIEHIEHQDRHTQIRELRMGGQTEQINVKPSGELPAYQVRPADATGTSAGARESGIGSTGPRVWTIGSF